MDRIQLGLWASESARRLERSRKLGTVSADAYRKTRTFIEGAVASQNLVMWTWRPTTTAALSDAVWLARSRQAIKESERAGAHPDLVDHMRALMEDGLDDMERTPEYLLEEV